MTRDSLMTLTKLVLVLSRNSIMFPATKAPSNIPINSSLPISARVARMPSTTSSRSAVFADCRISGASLSSCNLTRSRRANASSGLVSQLLALTSHSFGPRQPKRKIKSFQSFIKSAASALSEEVKRSKRPSTPASNSPVRISELRTLREISQSTNEGSAESTLPKPANTFIGIVGSPIASPTAKSNPGANPDPDEVKQCNVKPE